MKTFALRRSQWVPRALPEVFSFFERPENLAVLTPPDLGFKILTPSPISMRSGSLIDYEVRPFGVPTRWRTLIETYEPPRGFADSQVRGPYALWRHVHRFESENDGTRMTDEVDYALPLGPLGLLARPFVDAELKRIFDFRERIVARLFAGRSGGKTMDIVIAGGAGFIGRKLTERLIGQGHRVTALTRRPERACAPSGVKLMAWNPEKPDGRWRRAIQDAEAVVNLAGEGIADGRWTPARKKRLLDSRVESTKAVVDALGRASVLINASAVGFYGRFGDAATERTPKGEGFLADVCEGWEREALRARDFGTRTVLLRLGVVLGRDGGALKKMLLPFNLGIGGRLGSGKQWFPWVHEDDVVGLIEAALKDKIYDGPVNVVAPGAVQNDAFTSALARALRRPAIFPAPAFALRLVLGEMAGMLLEGRRVVPAAAQANGYAFRFADIDSALSDLTR